MRDVLSKRCSSFQPLNDLSSGIEDVTIGQYSWSTDGRGTDVRSPYEALTELEESGELLQVKVYLDNGCQRISYTSLIPQDIIKNYTDQVIDYDHY